MNIDYSVCFDVEASTAKSKASRLKAKQLREQCENFRLISINKRLSGFLGTYLAVVSTEIFYTFGIFFRKEKPDVIFTRTFFGHFLVLIKLFLPVKIIREVHSEFKDESKIYFKNSVFKRKLSTIINFIDTSSLSKVDGIIFNNPDLEEYFIDKYRLDRERTLSVYNASDSDLFFPEDKETVRDRLGLSHTKQDRVLTFTGSIAEWHGIEYLAEVFRVLIRDYGSKYHLYVVGCRNDPYHLHLKTEFGDIPNLKFVDRVPVDVARDYVNASDVCMVTTAQILKSQGSPTKMYDYIACGKPIITQKNVNGYGSVVDEHNLGCTVDFMEPEEAARDIEEFFETADFNAIAVHNRNKAENELNWCNAIEKWVQFANNI